MNATDKTAIALQRQVDLLKATASEATFAQAPAAPVDPAENLRSIVQAQYDARARRTTQAMTETAAQTEATFAQADDDGDGDTMAKCRAAMQAHYDSAARR